MNLRRLKYFVKIVDVGSLTQAADLLHIAQPALSQQLAALEGEVRQQLLVRNKRGVTPTEAGKVLYRHAQLILRQRAKGQQHSVRYRGRLSCDRRQVLPDGSASNPGDRPRRDDRRRRCKEDASRDCLEGSRRIRRLARYADD